MESGKVKRSLYFTYATAAGVTPLLISFGLLGLFQATSGAASFWLSDWTQDATLTNASLIGGQRFEDRQDYYLMVYGIFGVFPLIFITFAYILFWLRTVIASKRLHLSMLKAIFRCPMAFFDTNPIGRIMNRFSRDTEVVDSHLPMFIWDVGSTLCTLLAMCAVISINTPLFLTIVIPVVILYLLIQMFYIPTSRAVSLYLDALADVIVFSSALFAVLSPGLSGALVGLSVSYAVQFSTSMVWLVRMMSEVETNIISVERLKEYADLKSEAKWIVSANRPPRNWPSEGRLDFKGYKTRYRKDLDLVLKGITCSFKPGEKIGIVGRTGAGKSSLALALFRLIEASEGAIWVDRIRISKLGLHDVRSRLTSLPQDPVLFYGSIHMNHDPVCQFGDDQLWQALVTANLRDFVQSLPGKLDYQVGEEGQSLSFGQRQLVCLARALLKKTKILILDEATAAVDMETDQLIQDTIRSEFDQSTILTIAHRLNTIMDYDHIMVLDNGLIKEFDTPSRLLANTKSAFYAMAKDANLV